MKFHLTVSVRPGGTCRVGRVRGSFHKSSYERFLFYEFVEPMLNYWCNEFVAFTNLSETGPRTRPIFPPTSILRKRDFKRLQSSLHHDVNLERNFTRYLEIYNTMIRLAVFGRFSFSAHILKLLRIFVSYA